MQNILVVVDYQKDFVDGALGFDGAERLEKGICQKVEQALNSGQKVFFTRDTHQKDYLQTREGKHLPVMHCEKETDGWQLYGKLKAYENQPGVFVVDKPSFGSLDLGKEITKVCPDVERIELMGLVTNLCVISNAVILQNYFPNADIVLCASLCDSYDKKLHQAALDVMRGMQMTIE